MRSEPIKHSSFDSIYRHEYTVVEERHGDVSLFPHTDQLPVISRAINLEFYGGLPSSIARVNHRGDGFHKIVLKQSVDSFCFMVNGTRADRLRLYGLPDNDLVFKVAVVQQITEQTQRGLHHRFRLYSGDRFFSDIQLCGKNVVFTDHVLQRFSARASDPTINDTYMLLRHLYGAAIISMTVGPGPALIVPDGSSLIAFPYEETDTEYILTTCLTVNEIHTLEFDLPPRVMHFHYGPGYIPPRIHTWIPTDLVLAHHKAWTRKEPRTEMPPLPRKPLTWNWLACHARDYTIKRGYGPGASLCFFDYLPGPFVAETKPGVPLPRVDELFIYKKIHPEYDWDTAFAERDAKITRPKLSTV
ncbi:MAG: hypothetical protein HZA88_24215 [Verrucomicrobia bacterium]|nr:hypothetical protein [Verrucomicrobiota bacterium]